MAYRHVWIGPDGMKQNLCSLTCRKRAVKSKTTGCREAPGVPDRIVRINNVLPLREVQGDIPARHDAMVADVDDPGMETTGKRTLF